jgi:iron complex outermembrane receptor protein
VVYAPVEDLYFKALYGTAFRAPSHGELYFTNNPVVQGNEDLKPEKISTMEGLIGYTLTENMSGRVTYFQNKTEDLIQYGEGGLCDNIGEIESQGVEAEVKLSFDEQTYAYGNLSYQDVKDTTHATITSEGGQVYTHKDFDLGNYAKWMGNIGVNHDITEKLNVNISLNYVGEKERSEEKMWSGEALVRRDQRDPLDSCLLVNASVTVRNFLKGLELQVSGFNLFDADHRDPDPEGVLANDMPRPGRWFMGRISYAF